MTRVVAGAGRLQAVERLGGDGDGRRIADGALGVADVVVDGLRHADEGRLVGASSRRRMSRLPSPPTPISPSRCSSRRPSTISAERSFSAAVGHRKGEGIAAVGAAEERAALARQRRIEPAGIERLGVDRAIAAGPSVPWLMPIVVQP